MDENMGRRTVSGLLLTKGGSILLFREDSAPRKPSTCCSRLGCSSKHLADKDRQMHRAAAREAAQSPGRSQLLRKPNRKPSQGSASSVRIGRNAENDNRPRETPERDLLARLKERVNASRKRSLTREKSPSSPNGASYFGSSRSIPRPSHRAALRIRKAGEGANAGVEQVARDQAPTEGFISGFLPRYRSSLQGGLSSLEDSMEDSNGYSRFDMEGSEEPGNHFIFNDRHRGMRMDIDGMSYEELLALGERIGTVSTGLLDDALSKCLNRSIYMPTTSEAHEDCDRKCSICQEEYSAGEEVGKMTCKHYYHISCIQHWLRLKNWCPICKSVALNTTN